MAEQRRNERRCAAKRVEVYNHRDRRAYEFVATDASAGGLFLVGPSKPFRLGQAVTLRMTVPGLDALVVVGAEIVRLGHGQGSSGDSGIGVELFLPHEVLAPDTPQPPASR